MSTSDVNSTYIPISDIIKNNDYKVMILGINKDTHKITILKIDDHEENESDHS
jgi:hypothetical protein